MNDTPSPPSDLPPSATRRSFVSAALAIIAGTAAVVTPLAAGIATFLTPLFRKSQSALVRVALLEQVPDDGIPRYFPVVADREDAWTRYPAQRIGAVYLIRSKGEQTPKAFTAKCPHAGCFIGYAAGEDVFRCPCHTSAFKLDGTRVRGDAEVSPRDMDPLRVEIRQVGSEPASRGRRLRRRRGKGAPHPDDSPTADAADAHSAVWVEFVDFQTGHKQRIPTT